VTSMRRRWTAQRKNLPSSGLAKKVIPSIRYVSFHFATVLSLVFVLQTFKKVPHLDSGCVTLYLKVREIL
jgi:hypothetical protein